MCKDVEMIEKALEIAFKAHSGQYDLDGKPVILHPMHVGLIYGSTPNEKIVGLLHDVVEDTSYTFEDLKREGFSDEVIGALRLLTHDKNVSYENYITNIKNSHNKLAMAVKINDLHHNLKRGRAGNHQKQVSKHSKALEMLQ